MRVREIEASQSARVAGDHKRFRFHIRRMNRYRNRMLQEAFLFMEAFYWNASRAAESAAVRQRNAQRACRLRCRQ